MSEEIRTASKRMPEDHEDTGSALVESDMSTETGQTPPGIVARLAELPVPNPGGAFVLDRDGVQLAMVNRDDWIAIDRRWHRVVACVAVNGWVSLVTEPETRGICAHFSTMVYLARKISCEAVSAVRRSAEETAGKR
jgi:hypothetical protein